MNIETTIVKRNDDMLATAMDGEVVMMDAEDGAYFSISSGVGARIWELLTEPKSVAQLISAIQSEFKVDPKTCQTDVTEFVDQLLDKNILQKQA